MKYIKYILLIVLSYLVTACVSPIPLDSQTATTDYKAEEQILLAVIDKRTRVQHIEKSNKKDQGDFDLDDYGSPDNEPMVRDPSFVGIAHGVYGIPSDWTIKMIGMKEDKDKYLAELLQDKIVKGLKDDGWLITPVKMSNPEINEARELMINNRANKLIILVINEWYFSINLNWVSAFNFDTNTDIYVFDVADGLILRKNIKERDVVDEKYDDSFQNLIYQAYKAQLDQIFNDPDLKNLFVH